jgi:type IV pilus assembly protein PilM
MRLRRHRLSAVPQKRPVLWRGGRKQQEIVGLDIGSHLVKLVALTRTAGRLRLEVAMSAPLPHDAVSDGEIVDPAAVIAVLRSLVESQPLPTRRVATAVSGRAIIVKNVWMDRVPESGLSQAVQWEAEQHIPFDLNDVYFDHQVLRVDESANKMQVLIVAAKREGIDGLATLVSEAGLQPAIVDVDSFAAQNAVLASYPMTSDAIETLIDVGAEFTNIIVLSREEPILTSNVAFGTSRLVDAALKHFPATAEEVQSALRASDASPELAAVVTAAAEDLSVAVDRSLSYLDGRNAGEPPGLARLIVCGGGACVPALVEFLRSRHRLPVEVANPLAALDTTGVGLGHVTQRAPLFTVGVGLALRHLED